MSYRSIVCVKGFVCLVCSLPERTRSRDDDAFLRYFQNFPEVSHADHIIFLYARASNHVILYFWVFLNTSKVNFMSKRVSKILNLAIGINMIAHDSEYFSTFNIGIYGFIRHVARFYFSIYTFYIFRLFAYPTNITSFI